MNIVKLFKYVVLISSSALSATAFAGLRWSVMLLNTTDSPVIITPKSDSCIYKDFESEVVLLPNAPRVLYAEEKNIAACNGGYNGILKLELLAKVFPGTEKELSTTIKLIHSNKWPGVSIETNDSEDTHNGQVFPRDSTLDGVVVFDNLGKPSSSFVRVRGDDVQ